MKTLVLTVFLTSILAMAEDPVTLEVRCLHSKNRVYTEVSGQIDETSGKGTLHAYQIDQDANTETFNSEMAAETLPETSIGLLELLLKDKKTDLSAKLAINLEGQRGTLSILNQEIALTCATTEKRIVRFSYVNGGITSGLNNFSIAEAGLAREAAKICPTSKQVLTDEIQFKIEGCGRLLTQKQSPSEEVSHFEKQETFTPISYFRCYPQVSAKAVVACREPRS